MKLTLSITDKQVIALDQALKLPRAEFMAAIEGEQDGLGALILHIRSILEMSLDEDDVVDLDYDGEDEDGGDDVEYTTAN